MTKLLAFSALSKQYQIGVDKSGLTYSLCNTSLIIIQPGQFVSMLLFMVVIRRYRGTTGII